MKLATWNVNSIRARERRVVDWIGKVEPDVLCMQETKVVDDDFPTSELQRLGYQIAMSGQKTYNGVAIASRLPLENVEIGLGDDDLDVEKRLIAATTQGLRIVNVYVPNGKSVDSPDFGKKLRWLERLRRHLDDHAHAEDAVLVCGDFNVAREARDVYDPKRYEGQIHFHPKERDALTNVLDFGLVDAFRIHEEDPKHYSWWDYRGPMFRRNLGLRIDYVFVSEPLVKRCSACWIDRDARAEQKPSDHAPVVVELD